MASPATDPSSSPSLASSAVKVGVPRKLFHQPPHPADRMHHTHVPPLKRKLLLADQPSSSSPAQAHGEKENGDPQGLHPQPRLPLGEAAEQASAGHLPHKRESRLKKLKSVSALTSSSERIALKNAGQPAHAQQQQQGHVSLAHMQAALPPPLDLEALLSHQQSARGEGRSAASATHGMLSSSSDETLKQLTNIVSRKKRAGEAPAEPQPDPTATAAARPTKKARSLCGSEASKLISRRGDRMEEEGEEGEGSSLRSSSEMSVTLSHVRQRSRRHARRASYDASQLWMARCRHAEAEERAEAEDSSTRVPTLAGRSSRLDIRPVPLWSELHRKDAAQQASKGSPDQAERRRRRSRSVGDLKQLMASCDEAASAAQQAAQPPKKRERKRKRNSLVRAIDKLISVAGITVNKEEGSAAEKAEEKASMDASPENESSGASSRDRANSDAANEECYADVDVSVRGGSMRDIFRYVALANWKRIAVSDDSSSTMLVWKDRSLALNFLFGLRRWKVSNKDLFAMLLEEYHFGPKSHVTKHLNRDLEQERKDMKPLRQRLAAFVHLWVLYNYKSEKEKRLVGRFLDLLKRDGLHDEVKEIQLKIWNACQEQDKLQAIQKLTPKRRPGIPAVAASPMASPRRPIPGSTPNPIYSASPSPRRPPSSLRPSSSLIAKGAGPASTPVRTPLRTGRTPAAVPPTPPKTPSSSAASAGAVSMLTLSTTAVAKQLTRVEHELFCAVPASEFMDICKSNVSRPSLSRLVEHTNKISYWVATQIVTLSRNKDKVKMLHKFITLAEKCLRLRNFASASAILIGLNLSLITRMKDVWEALPSKQLALFEKIKGIPMADANYRCLRSLVRRERVRLERLEMMAQHLKDVDPALLVPPQSSSSSSATEASESSAAGAESTMELTPPVIPFMAIYNKDFTFVEEQPSSFEDGRINFDKMQIVGGLLREIHLFQHQLSSIDSIETDPVVEEYLSNITYLSEETLWSLSGIHTSLRS